MRGAKVYILGSGTPTPNPDRFGTAFLLKVDNEDLIMVDCGPAATWKLSKIGYAPLDVSHLFFTHHHFDHNVDTPCLLLARWDQLTDAGKAINIFGPPPTEDFIEKLVGPNGAYQPDFNSRIHWTTTQQIHVNRGGSLPRKAPQYLAKDISPGFRYTIKTGSSTIAVTASLARHAQPTLESLSYRFDTAHGSIVFTGDTEYCQETVDIAKNADYLFCMALDGAKLQGVAGVEDAARIAFEATVKTLVLTHTSPKASKLEDQHRAVARARRFFDGNVVFGEELSVFVL